MRKQNNKMHYTVEFQDCFLREKYDKLISAQHDMASDFCEAIKNFNASPLKSQEQTIRCNIVAHLDNGENKVVREFVLTMKINELSDLPWFS